jgi:hypothetical protein
MAESSDYYDSDSLSEYDALRKRDEALSELQVLLLFEEFEDLVKEQGDYAVSIKGPTSFMMDAQDLPATIARDFNMLSHFAVLDITIDLYRPNPNHQSEIQPDWFLSIGFNIKGKRFRGNVSKEEFLLINQSDDFCPTQSYEPIVGADLITALLIANSSDKDLANQYKALKRSGLPVDEVLERMTLTLSDYCSVKEINQFCPLIRVGDGALQIYTSSRGDQLSEQQNYIYLTRPARQGIIVDELYFHGISEEPDEMDLVVKRGFIDSDINHLDRLPLLLNDRKAPALTEIDPVKKLPLWLDIVDKVKQAIQQAAGIAA